MMGSPSARGALWRLAAGLAIVASACTGTATSSKGASTNSTDGAPASGCVALELAVSPEKGDLLTELGRDFAKSPDGKLGKRCIGVRVKAKSSGAATAALARGWDEGVDGPRPTIWSPSSSAWGSVLNQRLDDEGRPPLVGEGKPFMLTPLVIAMPKPMADALGYPAKQIGWSDLRTLATSKDGWAAFGSPTWGSFRLGKTNPNFSTSGLSALIAQGYAATGKTTRLSTEDLDGQAVQDFAKDLEGAVVHYGDTTLAFLNNFARADARGTALTYVSAVAVEEKSVIDYNLGNPDGRLDPGEELRPPKVPLVAVYPKEGTLFSDNPFFVVDAPWVTAEQKEAAAKFGDFVQKPENQQKVLTFGFRPGNSAVKVGAPISAANGVDPSQPQVVLPVPSSQVMDKLLSQWDEQRKAARVMLVMDVSGSMGESAGSGTKATKLELAKTAAIKALDQFLDRDEVGLRLFTTNIDNKGADFLDVVPIGRISANRDKLKAQIQNLTPLRGTPLYSVAQRSFEDMSAGYDATRINAVVLLTDGFNDDGKPGDDEQQLVALLAKLRAGAEGENSKPVRVFPIGYGKQADLDTLRQLAEATNASVYDASNPASIDAVFTAVISNF